MTHLKDTDKDHALSAWNERRRRHRDDRRAPVVIDNSKLPVDWPMWFTCHACFGWVIVPEDYLTSQAICYDCRDLADKGWIIEQLDGAWVKS